MEKKRVKKGENYWYIYSRTLEVKEVRERGDSIDGIYYEHNNYFQTQAEAEAMARKIRAVLNGANVIEMPSEEEMKEAKPTFSTDYDPYYAELIRDGFKMCYYWLKSKIKK